MRLGGGARRYCYCVNGNEAFAVTIGPVPAAAALKANEFLRTKGIMQPERACATVDGLG